MKRMLRALMMATMLASVVDCLAYDWPGAGQIAVIPANTRAEITDSNLATVKALAGIDLSATGSSVKFVTTSAIEFAVPFTGTGLVLATTGAGKIVFKGDNSNFRGSFDFSNCAVEAATTTAFGSGCQVKYYCVNTSTASADRQLVFTAAGEYNVPIYYLGGSSATHGIEYSEGVVNKGALRITCQYLAALRGPGTQAGPITLEGGNYYLYALNGIVMTGSTISSVNGVGHIAGQREPYSIGSKLSDDIVDVQILVGSGKAVTMLAEDCIPETCALTVGVSWYTAGILDLNGFNQRCKKITANYTAASITSPTAASLAICNLDADYSMVGVVNGAASIVYDCASGKVLTLAGASNATTGGLIASNGTLVVAATANFPSISLLAAAGNGVLQVNSTAINSGKVKLSVSENGILKFAGGTVVTPSFVVDGVALSKGYYSSASPELKGRLVGALVQVSDGSPEPAAKTYTWKGTGGDSAFTTLGNWENDMDVTASTVADAFVFKTPAEGDAVASVDCKAQMSSLSIAAGNKDWLFGNGGGSLAFGVSAGSLTVAKGGANRTITCCVPLSVAAGEQTWSVPTGDTLSFCGGVAIGNQARVTKTGQGALVFEGGVSTFAGSFVDNDGGQVFVNGAMIDGMGSGYFRIDPTVSASTPFANLVLSNATVRKSVQICGRDKNYILQTVVGTTNVIDGKVSVENGGNARVYVAANSELEITGGLTAQSVLFIPTCSANAALVFSGAPMSAYLYADSYAAGCIAFAAQGNCALNGANPICCTIRCDVDNPFVEGQVFTLGPGWSGGKQGLNRGSVDLNGHTVRLGQLITANKEGATDNNRGFVMSSTPGELVLTAEGVSYVHDASWTGHSTLNLAGQNASLTLSNVSTSDGALKVSASGATLTLGTDASWLNCTKVEVSAGTFAVTKRGQLDKETVCLYVSNGKVSIPAGVNLRVKELYFPDGQGGWKLQSSGTYSAATDSAHFAGGGVLTAGKMGLFIVVQ